MTGFLVNEGATLIFANLFAQTEAETMVHRLFAFFFFALGVLNAFAADEKKVVGLGEACDAVAGIVCKSGLECNASKTDVAGVCANSSTRTPAEEVRLQKPTDGE